MTDSSSEDEVEDDESPTDCTFEERAVQSIDDVARFARSLARNDDDADDLVQETYLRAFRGRHTWREGADMRRWLFTICKNVFLRSMERKRDVVSLDDAGDEAIAAARLHNEMVQAGEADLFDRIDVGPAIVSAIHDLPPVYRPVVVLVDMEGYNYEDAAAALEIPVGTVRSRLFRARRQLQEALREHARDAGFGGARLNLGGSA